MDSAVRNLFTGMGLALLATVIWSGNFIAARGVFEHIPPGMLAFFRWVTATIVILPFAIKTLKADWAIMRRSPGYLFWTALTGITLFNTLVYIGAHYTTAINLALIGTTSSPIFAVILARIFLKEKISGRKLAGMILCVCGVLLVMSQGYLDNLLHLRITTGDVWALMAALSFAIYNTLVRRKPVAVSSTGFLAIIFSIGTLLLVPFVGWEVYKGEQVEWNTNLVLVILFLGIGASVIAFLCWNMAVSKLGAGRTALFGNLIPIFSSMEALIILNESLTDIHLWSMWLVITGLLWANWPSRDRNNKH
jgi:drug/metabolite transporter (DMT)-like permease